MKVHNKVCQFTVFSVGKAATMLANNKLLSFQGAYLNDS